MPHQAEGNSGFTLVELVMATALAGVILTSALPNLQQLQNEWALWTSARMLESSLHWGRAHAVSSNTSMMLTVAEDGRSVCWFDGYSGERFGDSVRLFPGRVRLVGWPRRSLRFYPKGNAVPAGTYILQGAKGTYRVIASPGGRIRIQRD